MKDINIYYGPKIGFNKILKFDSPAVTLTNLAILSDKKMKEHSFKTSSRRRVDGDDEIYEEIPKIKIPILVAYSDEYAALSENAIQGFFSFLSQFEIETIYLQNPPTYIVSQFYKLQYKPNVFQYVYNSINHDVIKTINKEFSDTIIGQESVKKKLMSNLYPLCNANCHKPLAMLFYGPTGVGKTETAKFLSKILKQQLFRKQFSMFNSEEFVSYLFGGKHSQNSFAKELLERESNIILLDEFDKTNTLFHSAFYQMFDEGIFEDKNYTVYLDKPIIICTSNYSSLEEIKEKLGAPMYSRFNSIIKYNELDLSSIHKIIIKELDEQYANLNDWEKSVVNREVLLKNILSEIEYYDNVRQIQHIIKDKMSSVLVDYIINN